VHQTRYLDKKTDFFYVKSTLLN